MISPFLGIPQEEHPRQTVPAVPAVRPLRAGFEAKKDVPQHPAAFLAPGVLDKPWGDPTAHRRRAGKGHWDAASPQFVEDSAIVYSREWGGPDPDRTWDEPSSHRRPTAAKGHWDAAERESCWDAAGKEHWDAAGKEHWDAAGKGHWDAAGKGHWDAAGKGHWDAADVDHANGSSVGPGSGWGRDKSRGSSQSTGPKSKAKTNTKRSPDNKGNQKGNGHSKAKRAPHHTPRRNSNAGEGEGWTEHQMAYQGGLDRDGAPGQPAAKKASGLDLFLRYQRAVKT